MFDLSIPKLLVLAVIALVIFGPHELPKIASQAGRALRDLRKIAEGAKNDLREGLGPEFADFDIDDLNPKRFMQKHLFDDVNGDRRPESLVGSGRRASRGQRHAARPRRASPVRPRRDLARAALAGRQAEVTPGQPAAAGADLVRDLPQRQARRGVGVAEHQRHPRVAALAKPDV